MIHGRMLALAVAALLTSGCATGSSLAPPAPPQQPQTAGQAPAESSAARFILANVGRSSAASRAPEGFSGGGDDDGDRGELQLPLLQPCGAGAFATDCSVWVFAPGHSTRAGSRSAQSLAPASPPALNFCRDGGAFPADLGPPATTSQLLFATFTFGLTYTGTKATPIVTFVTRSSNVTLAGSFTGNATTASLQLTPVLTAGASRGWLVFFTWSWPADVLLVPYEINEFQLAASSDPLVIPAGGSATLGAFDCLGRPISARIAGSGFGFNHNLSGRTFTSPANELNVPVFGGERPSGFISLSDDRGAQVTVPVTH
jgi:hypothetical protein